MFSEVPHFTEKGKTGIYADTNVCKISGDRVWRLMMLIRDIFEVYKNEPAGTVDS